MTRVTDESPCILEHPHEFQRHTNSGGEEWELHHGDPGHIVDVAHGFAGETLTDRVAISLMVTFGAAEPRSDISRYPASYVAMFSDMARDLIERFQVTDLPGHEG